MTTNYDFVSTQVNKICDSNCWLTPKKDCPYYCVCANEALTQSPDVYERTRSFEAALVARYNELHKKETAT